MTPLSTHDRIAGRTAMVTGAGNGLGRRIALALVERGARVIAAGRDEGKLSRLADEAADLAGSIRVATVDVADPAAVASVTAEVADEEISILVNNAGVAGPVAPLTDIRADEWDEVFHVNVRGTFLMCRAVLPGMIERRRGDIINIASVTGKRPLARRTPYAASKLAVIGLTTTLALEVGPLGITVNSLSPGPVAGPRMVRNFTLEAQRTGTSYAEAERAYVSRAALHRMLTEDEVAHAVVAMLHMPGLTAADIDLSAGMVGR
ncbi:SDR family NAD(P)-dependent oxidoreductase [Rhizomonospora bruguierae]|uniref:SDR family NAD(P)-dependent oxidoreductase n=1 Tax=Rhizomonospora bruguierae TaxID=1581705 RepID=UPI001BCB9FBC|nr:SDR family NAD(P)-dependent oxidoreductase [Micromonospora sp. NBRC 107566]